MPSVFYLLHIKDRAEKLNCSVTDCFVIFQIVDAVSDTFEFSHSFIHRDGQIPVDTEPQNVCAGEVKRTACKTKCAQNPKQDYRRSHLI